MRRLLYIALLIFWFNNSYSQHMLGIKACGGLSEIRETTNVTDAGTIKNYFVPSGQGGIFYNYAKGRSLFGAELLFVQIEGKNHYDSPFTDAYGNSIGHEEADLWLHISYLSVPIYYGFTLKNFNINLGVQGGYPVMSSGRGEANGEISGTPIHYEVKYNKLYINPIDFGPRTGLFFKISKSLSLEANYYHGITNIYKGSPFFRKVRQMTIGLKYSVIRSGK
jgi:hypothetical protein